MQVVVTLKMTPEELAVLDWLRQKLQASSRSEAMRSVVFHAARMWGASVQLLNAAAAARLEHPPQRNLSQSLVTWEE